MRNHPAMMTNFYDLLLSFRSFLMLAKWASQDITSHLVPFGQELGQSTDQLKILLGKVEGKLTRMKAEGHSGRRVTQFE